MRFLDTSRIRTRIDERVRSSDGTELSVDLYLPPQPGRYPVLLNRTAADNNRFGRPGVSLPPAERWKLFAAQGFIVAAADVRGRGDSDGEFTPFLNEAADGAATLAWLRTLEEADGKVGLFGSGYGAFCAWAAAVADRQVDALASISPFGAVGEGLPHRGGAVRLDWLFWMHLIGGRTVQPANVPPWPSIYRHWPLATMDEALGRSDIWWREWLAHPTPADAFWKPLDIAADIAALSTSGLHVTGWWDGQLAAALYYYRAACRSNAPQQLIVGPWDSSAARRPLAQLGGFDFGPRSLLDLDETLVEFFDTHLRPDSRGRDPTSAPARLFVTGRNEWVITAGAFTEEQQSDSCQTLELHMSSTLGSNTCRGDGRLRHVPPSIRGCDSITHNPDVPVDFQPQFVSFATGANPLGFTLEQAHLTARDEALVYTSDVLEEAVTVFGTPIVTLTVRTTAADADLYVLLSDSFPLGTRDLHLAHAAVRLATLSAFKAGEALTVHLKLDAVTHDFLRGHQIRLTVVPSLYPLYARNPHVAGYTTTRQPTFAEIELLHGSGIAARLELPLAADGTAYRG
jgi:putative CocE/NonD family hydrolase